jgi:hypothetical protein
MSGDHTSFKFGHARTPLIGDFGRSPLAVESKVKLFD